MIQNTSFPSNKSLDRVTADAHLLVTRRLRIVSALSLVLLSGCHTRQAPTEGILEQQQSRDRRQTTRAAEHHTASKVLADTEMTAPQASAKPATMLARAAPAAEAKTELDEVVVTGSRIRHAEPLAMAPAADSAAFAAMPEPARIEEETYATITPNSVKQVATDPVSTFSVDVDTGAYTVVRRMLGDRVLPPKDAIRIEEFINYFDFSYPLPKARSQPFSVTTELAASPFNANRELLLVGLQGYQVAKSEIPPANLVFLIDVSGSMNEPNKLPLLKASFAKLVENLSGKDRVSIVVYAGAAGTVLEPTSGSDKSNILAALDRLSAGGSTNGGEGLALAYRLAQQAKIPGGINRIVLATDGDFNVGNFDSESLQSFVAQQREAGIELSTLGFGSGNYNDEIAERLANVGNGNYSYIDSEREAERVLSRELSSTLYTIAKDVKIQIEFNPQQVSEYRLLGYENRLLKREDFNNDQVDAGEIGAGHTVTAVYEIVRKGSGGESADALRYAGNTGNDATGNRTGKAAAELGFLKLRYKLPNATRSTLISQSLPNKASAPTPRMELATSVIGFAELLRNSEHIGGFNFAAVLAALERADQTSLGSNSNRLAPDDRGERAELKALVQTAQALKKSSAVTPIATN